MPNELKRVEIKITGQVQGVFFRQGVGEIAEKFGLTGWVKNEQDGSVWVVAEGRKEDLQKLVEWCRKGTDWSRVDDIKIKWQEASGEFKKFNLVY